MIQFICPWCQKSLETAEGTVGQQIVCPTCGKELSITNKDILPPGVERPRTPHAPAGGTVAQDEDVMDVVSVVPVVTPVGEDQKSKGNSTGQKFCVECGELIRVRAAICPKCGVSQSEVHNRPKKFCHDCGSSIPGNADICPKCGVEQGAGSSNDGANSNRIAAGVCGILLGALGIHKFILGYTSSGIITLLVSILGFCFYGWLVMHVIGIIEGVMYLTMTDADFQRIHGKLQRPWF